MCLAKVIFIRLAQDGNTSQPCGGFCPFADYERAQDCDKTHVNLFYYAKVNLKGPFCKLNQGDKDNQRGHFVICINSKYATIGRGAILQFALKQSRLS